MAKPHFQLGTALFGLINLGLLATLIQVTSAERSTDWKDDIHSMLERLVPTSASLKATSNSHEMPNSAEDDQPSYSSNDETSSSFDYSSIQQSPSTLLIPSEVSDNDGLDSRGLNLTRMHEEAIQYRKAQIKDALLNKLRLDLGKLPSPKLAKLIPRFPHHILGNAPMQMDSVAPKDNYHAKVKTLLRFPQKVPSAKATAIRSDLVTKTIFTPLPLTVSRETLKKATLMIYVKTPKGSEGQYTTLDIQTNRMTKKSLIFSEKVALQPQGNWYHIDITNECKAWLRDEWSKNLGLVATALYDGEDLVGYDSRQAVNNDTIDRVPFLKLELNDYDPGLKRRSFDSLPISCEPEDQEKRCCRYNFVLDFTELGPEFDFIISPKRYYANYCAGNCPSYHLPNIPLTLGLRRKVQRCCTPSQLDSLPLLYEDDYNGITQSELPGMTISACGCD